MGIFRDAGENVKDLFRGERVQVIDEHGNTVERKVELKPFVNPITLCRMLTWKNWLFFVVGLAAWTVDGYDFHSVSLSITALSKYYNVSKTDITTAITLTLLFRTVGAALFGAAGDFYGRKYPMTLNLVIIGLLQLGTAHAKTYHIFLAMRALFGIGMGGIWGCAMAMALESCPLEARGLMSGILQQGYSLGYLLAAVFNLSLAPRHGWQVLFYIGCGASIVVGLLRLAFPESQQFELAKKEGKRGDHTRRFFADLRIVFKAEWRKIIYACVLMSFFSYLEHSSQDAYPTFMQSGKGFTSQDASLVVIYVKVGGIIGGAVIGYVSQFIGRRRAIVVSCLITACLLPAFVLPNTIAGLALGGAFTQSFVRGAWGVVPVHLNEMSPPAFRASFPGICYQIGNMIASPAAQMVTGISGRISIYSKTLGEEVEAFGPTIAICTAIIAVGLATWTAVGKERLGTHFEYAIAGVDGLVVGKEDDLERGSSSQSSVEKQVESVEEKFEEK